MGGCVSDGGGGCSAMLRRRVILLKLRTNIITFILAALTSSFVLSSFLKCLTWASQARHGVDLAT